MSAPFASIHAAPADAPPLDESTWDSAFTLADFVQLPIQNAELWRATTRLARLTSDAEARAQALSAPARVLVLLEDWCGDAMYSVPFAQRIVDANPRLAMRVLQRDAHEALMQTHMAGEARSIPVVMLFDADGRELAWWGPRPSPLQEWMLRDGMAMEKPLRYKSVRTWYARDRGVTTVGELLSMLERAAHAERRAEIAPAAAAQRSATASPA
jgi:hypothetical protein